MLRILLLGTPVVFLDEKPVQIQRKLQRVLLFYLACQPGLISRYDLALVFWPDAPDEIARRRLREALSKLRTELPDPSILITDSQNVGLNPEKIWVDAVEVQNVSRRVWNQIRFIPLNSPLPEAMAAELQEMVGLWRADHFLSGVALPGSDQLDHWMSALTQELDYIHQQMLERLGYHMAASGNIEMGIYYLRQALKNDEQNEALHLQVLTWLNASGKRSDAVNYCGYLKTIYIDEPGQSLPPNLERMCQKIQTGGAASYPVPAQAWPIFPDLHVPFVGRADLLRSLSRSFQRGGTVVISGETGAGKTSLVRQLFLTLQPEPRLLLAPAHSAEQNLPFQPIIELLRHAILQEEWRQLPEIWAGPLSWILPELLSLRPELRVPAADPDAARPRIFEALRQLLLLATRQRRALFFLDDAHWSDESTLSALAYLQNKQFFEKHGLLVLAFRPEEPSAELQSYLDHIQRQTPVERFHLDELNSEDVYELYRFVLGQNPSPRLVERLSRDTGGNPLFLVETLRALLDILPDPASIRMIEEIPIASSIASLVRSRLRALSPRCRQTLEAAAVAGSSFSPDLLEFVLNTSPDQTAADLDELERRSLIRPDRTGEYAVSYHFVHEVFREILNRELTPARRRLLHLRTAQGLEALSNITGESSGALLAGHYQAAGQPGRACQYWIQAAEYARRLFSRQEAVAAYQRAEALLRQERTQISEECILRIYTGLADIAYESGDIAAIHSAATVLVHYGEQRSSTLLLGAGYSGRAQAALLKGDTGPAVEEIEDGVRFLTLAGHRHELMKAYLNRANIFHVLLRIPEAKAEYERVVEMGHGLFDPPVIQVTARALDMLSILTNTAGWPRKALELAQHSLRHSRLLSFTTDISATYAALGLSYYWLGAYRLAMDSCMKGLELISAGKKWRFAGLLHLVAARASLILGNLDESWTHLIRLSDYSRRFGYVDLLGDSLCIRGDVLLTLNNLPEAARAFREALDETGQNAFMSAYSRMQLGLTRGLLGETDQGLAELDEVIAFASQWDFGRVLVPARLSRGMVLGSKGSAAQAREEIEWALAQARERGLAAAEILAQLQLGRLDLAENNPLDALTRAETLLPQAERCEHVLFQLSGLELAARAAREAGRDPSGYTQRAAGLLEKMAGNAQSEPVKPHFEHFRRDWDETLFV